MFGTTVSFCRAPTPLVATLVQATIASTLITAIGSFTVIVKIYIFAQCTRAQIEFPEARSRFPLCAISASCLTCR